MKMLNSVTVNWKTFLVFILFTAFFTKDVFGQVTYRATEDALKQLVKDIEALRKAPLADIEGKKGEQAGLIGGSYVTKRGDTLNGIIQEQVPDLPLNYNIIRLAIVKANPHAFKRNNPNWMYAGKTLRLPGVEDIRGVVFRKGAKKPKSFTSNPDSWIKYP